MPDGLSCEWLSVEGVSLAPLRLPNGLLDLDEISFVGLMHEGSPARMLMGEVPQDG